MDKKLFRMLATILFLVATVAMFATPALAADVPSVRFLGADYVSGKGLVLYFDIPEGFEFETIAKNVVVNGVQFPLSCQFNANGLLACVAGVKKSDIGSKAFISFSGASFESKIPEANVRVCIGYTYNGYTYNIYDYGPEDIPWGLIGTYTQSCPAITGDVITFYNGNWAGLTLEDGYFDYTYVPDGAATCAPNFGNGYYYDDC